MLECDEDDSLGDFVDDSDARAEGDADALATLVTERAAERLKLRVMMPEGVFFAVIVALRDEFDDIVVEALGAAGPLGEDDDEASEVQLDE